jgi:hypothetical protein
MNFASPVEPGTVAVVQTPRFRCLGLMTQTGVWVEAYRPEIPLENVLHYETLSALPPPSEVVPVNKLRDCA